MSPAESAEFKFTSVDGLSVACRRWKADGVARGLIQISHGMGEHAGRYAGTIETLTSAGLTVYANDHRGHGRTATSAAQLGDFGAGGFDLLVEDMVRLSRIARSEDPRLPFFLLGHSMGSFAAQLYTLGHSSEIDGLILSGSGALDRLARLVSAAAPGENILNAAFEPARTPFDWLCRDTDIVDAFMADRLCFAQLQPASFASFLAAGTRLADLHNLRKIRPDLPVYLFSGSDDPVGQRLEGVNLLIDRYRQAGLSKISYDFYPGGRHEMLNETNCDEVHENLLLWICALVERQSQGNRQ